MILKYMNYIELFFNTKDIKKSEYFMILIQFAAIIFLSNASSRPAFFVIPPKPNQCFFFKKSYYSCIERLKECVKQFGSRLISKTVEDE